MNPKASYYYLLYKQSSSSSFKSHQTKTEIQQHNIKEEDDDNDNNNHEQDNHSQNYWSNFEWTGHELNQIQQMLKNNEQSCNVWNVEQGMIQHHDGHSRVEYLRKKLELDEAHEHWNKFYTHHQTKFFKDRHYLHKAFPEEFEVLYKNSIHNHAETDTDTSPFHPYETFVIVEIGCGVGNTVLPLLELSPFIHTTQDTNVAPKLLHVWGLDFSKVAIDLLKQDERFVQNHTMCHSSSISSSSSSSTTNTPITTNTHARAHAAVWDITKHYPKEIDVRLHEASDISLLLFCFSAIAPSLMVQTAHHVASTLKPGGILLLRDYGRYDEAQVKLGTSRKKRLGENYYVKHDSTRVYYFDLDDLRRLFGNETEEGAGLEVVEVKYIQRLYTNRLEGDVRRRVWVQGRFRKPVLQVKV